MIRPFSTFDGGGPGKGLPANLTVTTIAAPPAVPAPDPDRCIRSALAHPIGTPVLSERVRPGDRVAVIVDDITRATPVHAILPPVLESLAENQF